MAQDCETARNFAAVSATLRDRNLYLPAKKILRHCRNIQSSEAVPVGEKAEGARKLHQITIRIDCPLLRDIEPVRDSEMRVCLA
jgi:hypothetical protein